MGTGTISRLLSALALVCAVSGFHLGISRGSWEAGGACRRTSSGAMDAREFHGGCGCDRSASLRASSPTRAGIARASRGGRRERGAAQGRGGVAVMSSKGGQGAAFKKQSPKAANPQPSDNLPVCDINEDPLLGEVLTACAAADERKAERIKAVRVAQLTALTEYMIILEGNSRPQNQAISQNIEDRMEEVHQRVPRTQGAPESGWILLDYGDIIVHIMTPKSRSYYDLDSYWSAGEVVDISSVVTPNVVEAEEPPPEDVDPFWS